MAGRFVRASKYRHVFGKAHKRDLGYDNLRISRNAWDTNLIKANPEYLAVNWESSGGGAFAVVPINERGKLPDQIPLFRGHTAVVLDTDWNPFNDRFIASASEDGKVFLWHVPQGFSLHVDPEHIQDAVPVSKLSGHGRRVGHVLFNPAAENILASASNDLSIRIWDVGTGQTALTLKHPDVVQNLSWSADGAKLVTSCRDKKLRVWDVRQESPIHELPGHEGAKSSRVVWMGEHNRFATTGFSRMSNRQVGLWEPGRKDPIGGFASLDSISGICMPFWDDGSNCLYLAGKGDGNIRYFEYENDKFEFLSEYKSGDPQRGIAFLPRRGVNLHENEVMRAYKTVNDCLIESVSFTVPRRAETFQSDIYPPAIGLKPAVSAKEWLEGKTAVPHKIDLESVYDGNGPVEVAADYKPPVPAAPPAAPTPAPKKQPEPQPAAAPSVLPSMADQTASMAAMASKFTDGDASNHDEEPSEFDTASTPPTQRKPVSVPIEAKLKPTITKHQPASPAPSQPSEPVASTTAPAPTASTLSDKVATTAPSSSSVESYLEQIKQLIAEQNKIINSQSDKISQLTSEVDSLKVRVGSSSHDQSERIRQLELELEAARS